MTNDELVVSKERGDKGLVRKIDACCLPSSGSPLSAFMVDSSRSAARETLWIGKMTQRTQTWWRRRMIFLLFLSASGRTASFCLSLRSTRRAAFVSNWASPVTRHALHAVRYGPPSEETPGLPDPRRLSGMQQQQQNFRDLLEQVMSVQDPQHIPSLLTKHMDLILALNGEEGVAAVQSILDEARATQDEAMISQLEQAVDLTLTFAEDFVQTASSLDDQNKQLLGKIIRTMSDSSLPAREREDALDALFATEHVNFSAGFLRHLEGECSKLAQSRVLRQDTARTLEMLRIIQRRVLEEVGQDLGEAAQVLGQLIGYDNEAERLAVLSAGLSVRGVEFAREVKELTVEALDGLARVPGGGADPTLVKMVQGIDEAIQTYLDQESPFQ